jgi:GNAT superfamily N-acetyltransferase
LSAVPIRLARAEESALAADLIRRSIAELCADDYRRDPSVLERWLADKTDANFQRWIGQSDRSVIVGVSDDGQVSAVGMVKHDGEILLNYVDPGARFKGFSKALLRHMEEVLRRNGCTRAILYSTTAARDLYLSVGYVEGPKIESRYGTLPGTEMTKRL